MSVESAANASGKAIMREALGRRPAAHPDVTQGDDSPSRRGTRGRQLKPPRIWSKGKLGKGAQLTPVDFDSQSSNALVVPLLPVLG